MQTAADLIAWLPVAILAVTTIVANVSYRRMLRRLPKDQRSRHRIREQRGMSIL